MAGEYEQYKEVRKILDKANNPIQNLPPGKYRAIRDPEDLEAVILEDELADAHEAALEGTVKMSVREYAKFKKTKPQLIYYYIRRGDIKEEPCICGRKVIDIVSADAFFAAKEAKKRSAT